MIFNMCILTLHLHTPQKKTGQRKKATEIESEIEGEI